MSLIVFPPKLTIALAVAALSCAAPAFADTPADLANRIGALEKNVAQAQAELQVAQAYNVPPGSVPGGGGYGGGQQDTAGLDVRVDRLENQMRTLNGQIEQIQFDIKRLDDELRKFQQDVDFRFQDSGRGNSPAAQPRAGQRHSEITDPNVPAAANPVDSASAQYGTSGRGRRTSDAFDPSADPNAPGAPRQLGTLPSQDAAALQGNGQSDADSPTIIAAPSGVGPAPSLPKGPLVADRDPNAPLELASAPRTPPPTYAAPSAPPVLPAASGQGSAPGSGAGRNAPGGAQVASLPPSSGPRGDFDSAAAALKTQQFEIAEADFKSFLEKYPKDKLVPDAVFDLGESYFARSRYREAAEQYLKISSDYSKTARAPESLLRLGQSLDKLGAKEQACAAFAEVGRKYPSATSGVRTAADRESKRDQC